MIQQLKNLVREEKGQAMTEYGLIIGLIALAVVGALIFMGDTITAKFNDIVRNLGGTPSP